MRETRVIVYCYFCAVMNFKKYLIYFWGKTFFENYNFFLLILNDHKLQAIDFNVIIFPRYRYLPYFTFCKVHFPTKLRNLFSFPTRLKKSY